MSKPVTQQKVALVGPSSSYNLSPAPRATPLAQRLETGVATLDVFGQVARDAKRDRSSVFLDVMLFQMSHPLSRVSPLLRCCI